MDAGKDTVMDQKKTDAIYALLNIPVREPDTVKVKVARLGLEFTLKELSYDKLWILREGSTGDAQVNYLLSSIVEPNVRDPRWYQDHMGCPTPLDALKKLLKPGEITKLTKQVDLLNGYGMGSVVSVDMEDDQLQAQAVGKALEDLEKN